MKHFLFSVAVLLATCVQAQTQSDLGTVATSAESAYLKTNVAAVEIYNDLYKLFPLQYSVNVRAHKIDYLIHGTFRSKSEMQAARPQLEAIGQRIMQLDYLNRFTRDDSRRDGHAITVEPACDMLRQTDYLMFQWDDDAVEFGYYANYQPVQLSQACENTEIVKAMERAFAVCRKLKKTVNSVSVTFEGADYPAYTFCGVNRGQFYSTGTHYIIPGATTDDLLSLAKAMKKYEMREDVSVFYCGTLNKYEQVALRCRMTGFVDVAFGAALIGNDLHLIQVKSRAGGDVLLPRNWAEGDVPTR